MDELRVYRDIQMRTGGEIYIGVVGPVRTGKSTFIKRFMDLMVLPGIDNVHEREQARDELPQADDYDDGTEVYSERSGFGSYFR